MSEQIEQPEAEPELPQVGPYQLVRVLGAGGMGTVWLARHVMLGREVALKQVPIGNDPRVRDRTVREGRFAAALQHPNVVDVIDVLVDDNDVWLVMEYVASLTLGDLIKHRGALDPGEVAWIGARVADALAAGHDQDVIHRDVKPHNILVARSGTQVKLGDFGIARHRDDPRSTTMNSVIGTLPYMAPEVVKGGEPTEASDVFGLGATLFHAVEGVGAYGPDLQFDRLYPRVCNGQLEEPVRADELPPLRDVLHRMLQLVADSRIDTDLVAATLHDLGDGLTPATIEALRTYVPPVPKRPVPRAGGLHRPVTPPPSLPPVEQAPPRAAPPPAPLPDPPAAPPDGRGRRGWLRPIVAVGAVVALVAGIVTVAVTDPFGLRATTPGTPVPSSASPFDGLDALPGVRLAGGTRTADPCALLDTAGLRAAPATPGYLISGCETSVADARVTVSLREPDPPNAIKLERRRPDLTLGVATVVSLSARTAGGAVCETEIRYPVVVVTAAVRRTATDADRAQLCQLADRTAMLAIGRLRAGGIPEDMRRATATGLIGIDACSLADPAALATVPQLDGNRRDRTFGGWGCQVGSRTRGQPVVTISFQLAAPLRGTTTIGGRAGYTAPGPGFYNARDCAASVEYAQSSALVAARAEHIVIIVDSPGTGDPCGPAKAIAEAATRLLPPA